MAPPNVKIKHLIRSTSGNSRFPKLDECAHFHYENVELGPINVVLCDKTAESSKLPTFVNSSPNKENEVDRFCFLILVVSNSRKWVVRRTYNDFVFLDTQLHRCVYDRKYSLLKELQAVTQEDLDDDTAEERIRSNLTEYLERFSQLAGSLITCGPVLNWLELDNRGNRLIVTDEVAINTPAVAAAYVVICYSAQAADEISFDIGDMISVIDMPPPDESNWWRGKRGFEVGFFPSECVEVIGDKVPRGFKLSGGNSTKPVFRKHGKLIAFFRSFLLSRPSRRKLKQSGILKERVFGCDLGEHLLNTAREIPLVLKCCTEFLEEHGVVDGIYRLSGVSSNIQHLRNAFDEDCATNLGDPTIAQDIHSVASLLKMYFRELPNPLLTYQLYDKFVCAVQSNEDVRLLRIRDVVQQLPPPHYRTLQYLLNHLARVASHGEQTGMTPKNIAIVWAPNLLRSREVENGGVGALHVVGVQAVLTEYLIRFCDLIFDQKPIVPAHLDHEEGMTLRARPKSLAISTPTKLLSLEEARARALSTHLPLSQLKYIDVGGGPDQLPSKYHTVIDLPIGKQGHHKLKKSPSGWKSFFSRSRHSGSTRDKDRPSLRSSRKASTASLPHTSIQLQEMEDPLAEVQYRRKKLRTVKSAESLLQGSKGSSPVNICSTNQGCSHPSSPEVSLDSSLSSETGLKSPSLQKHIRSSSHESYFDNSIDMVTDPPVDEEEEHSLFYYVNEQMQKLREECIASSWKDKVFEADASNAEEEQCVDNIEETKPSETLEDPVPETEKVVRKQKLQCDDDIAQAKVQRLSWEEGEHSESVPYLPDFYYLENQVLSPGVSSPAENEVGRQKDLSCSPEPEDRSFWLPRSDQSVFCKLLGNHDEGYQLDPYAFYQCAIDKQSTCSSPSDNDVEENNKTVVERYGNAETVLVEVHAMQDSSSESGQDSPGVQQASIGLSPHSNILNAPKCHNSLPNLSSTENALLVSHDATGFCSLVESEELFMRDDIIPFDPPDIDTSLYAELFPPKDTGLLTDFTNKSVYCQDSPTEFMDGLQNDVDENLEMPKEALIIEESSVLQSGSRVEHDFSQVPSKTESDYDQPPSNTESNVEQSPSKTKSNFDQPPRKSDSDFVQDASKTDLDFAQAPKQTDSDEVTGTPENTGTACNMQLPEGKLKLQQVEMLPEEPKCDNFERMDFYNQSYKVKTPPSPVYPPQSLKLQDVHSLHTKIESMPIPKKRQIVNIPSPSSPLDEVRKKFELKTTSSDSAKDISTPCTKLQPVVKDAPSRLVLKQKQLFEASDSAPVEVGLLKRKSDSVMLSNKQESLFDKRKSEPPVPYREIVKKNVQKLDSIEQNIVDSNASDGTIGKQKSTPPSLFTQMKIRKLQSLQGTTSTTPAKLNNKPVDPWSDPILDMQEEYHPLKSYPEFTVITDTSSTSSKSKSSGVKDSQSLSTVVSVRETSAPCKKQEATVEKTLSQIITTPKEHSSSVPSEITFHSPDSSKDESSLMIDSCCSDKSTIDSKLSENFEDEATRRERINRIKEERRAQMREKLKTESFRLETEEKEKVLSKFRQRKDATRQGPEASTKSVGEVHPATGRENSLNDKCKTCLANKASCSCDQMEISLREKKAVSESKGLHKEVKSVVRKSDPVGDAKKSKCSISEPRSENFRRSGGDIRDRVAMFERSKDTTEPCRLGPNGKFLQKQGSATLTPSFVR